MLGLHRWVRFSSSCSAWGLLSRRSVCALPFAVAPLEEHGLQWLQLPGSRAQAQQLWLMGLIALWHVGSSQIRDRTRVSCIGRGILYHRVTREAPSLLKFYQPSKSSSKHPIHQGFFTPSIPAILPSPSDRSGLSDRSLYKVWLTGWT